MVGPSPHIAAARLAVRASLADMKSDHDVTVVVACSGGADSLALAATTAWVAQREKRIAQVAAVIVDHQWAAHSAQHADHAADQCRSLGFDPVIVKRVDCVDINSGPEAAARTARYAALDDVADKLNADLVLLGHTLTDQAEAVLLGLGRGSGTRAVAGMPAQRGRYRRPFLALTRHDTEAICAELNLDPVHDPANDDDQYRRVQVRTTAMPALRSVFGDHIDEQLARTADLARVDADYLDDVAASAAEEIMVRTSDDISASVTDLAALAPAIRRRVIRNLALASGVPADPLSSTHLRAVDALITSWRGQKATSLPGRHQASRHEGRILFR